MSLIGGDLEMGATGTVTHIDGDRVYAFGHPFYNLGPAEFPMTRAHVYTMLPEPDDLVQDLEPRRDDRHHAAGSRDGDRRHARQGPGAGSDDAHARSDRGGGAAPVTRTVKLNLVNDQLFTPLLAYVSMFNTLGSYERQYGAATLSVKSRARLKGHGELALEDVFAGDNPILGRLDRRGRAADDAAGATTIEAVDDRGARRHRDRGGDAAHRQHRAGLARRHPAPRRPHGAAQGAHPQSYRGEEKISTLPIEIPANAPSELTVLVSDGRQLNAMEQRELRGSLQPQTSRS